MTKDAASGPVNNLQQQVSGLRKLLDQKDKELAQCQKDTARLRQALTTAQREVEALRRRVIWLEDHYGVR